MEFVSIASSADRLVRAGQRILLETTASGTTNDDDFAHLSGSTNAGKTMRGNDGRDWTASSPGTQSLSPQQFTSTVSSSGLPSMVNDGERPLLSPSAEAELFLLATNFLLYVAMVIITTMIAKIYFPESLERGQNLQQGSNVTHISRSVSYRIVDRSTEEDDEGDEETENLLGLEEDDTEDCEQESSAATKRKRSKVGIDGDNQSRPPAEKNRSGRFLIDEPASELSPKPLVMRRLIFCCIMLNVTFVTWGLLQERMLTRRYPRFTGEYFTYTYALVFTNRFWTLLMSGVLLMYLKPTWSKSTVIYEYSFPSISNMLSSWCQYEALRYVSFPAATLFKSFKLAPVMAMGKFLGNREYPQYDYVVAVIIGIGIAMFMTSTDDLELGYDIYGVATSEKWTGILMLCLYLFFDSFTGQWQSRMFQRHRDLSMVELLFATSAFSTVLSLVTLIHTHELGPAISFVYRHSEIHLHFFLFSICSTIGQLTIFYTIKNFGAVVFTLIMTTRVLVSIALSCILYDHKVTATGFLGLMTVVGAVIYRVKRKAEGTQLIKWQGMGDEKASELVQEWHEHLDM